MTLSTEFSSLADRATKGEAVIADDDDTIQFTAPDLWVSVHQGHSAFGAAAKQRAEQEETANAAFIAWCFNHRAEIAAALQAVAVLQDVDAAEKLARLMWIDTTDKNYWDHLDEDTKNIYRSNAVAVIAAILKGDKNAQG